MTARFETGSFVHVGSHCGDIMMVECLKEASPGIMSRYDLLAIDGTRYANIGEYELSEASDDAVEAALRVKEMVQ